MASTFEPRSRGDREFLKFGLHDTATDSNPTVVHIGIQTKDIDGTTPGVVSAEDDSSILKGTKEGMLLVSTVQPRFFNYSSAFAGAYTNALVQSPPGSGLSIYITDVVFAAREAACSFKLTQGTAGATQIIPVIGLSANGEFAMNLTTPIKLTANSTCEITIAEGLNKGVIINGYIAS